MRERQEGRYYGLGISIQSIDGDILVGNVFEGSPAFRRGIRRGDIIARIEGESAKGWPSDKAVSRLKGPKGTSVNVSIKRRGFDELIDLTVERDEVNIPTLQGAFMVDERTGYVRLRDFSEVTDRDLGRALKDLQTKGMQQLLLDLRDNPGGPLDQAIRVANRFLPRGDMIVYTRGRIRNSDQDYRAMDDATLTEHAGGRAGEPQQRQRFRDRRRRAAGSRSRARRRRDDLRQGARAVGLSHQRQRGARVDDRPLLHAERTTHSAAVGRHASTNTSPTRTASRTARASTARAS